MRRIALLLTFLLSFGSVVFGADKIVRTRNGEDYKFFVDGNIVFNNGPQLLNTNKDLQSDDFPNTTTLYGWNLDGNGSYDGTAFAGSKTLTENGALTAADDVLSNSRYVDFDGANDWLSSTDAVFNFTGDFSIAVWVYRASWAAIGTTEVVLSRASGVDGWDLVLSAALDVIKFDDVTNSESVQVSFTALSAGWHHIVVVRDSGSNTSLYIDGKLAATNSTPAGALTAAGNLEIGSFNGGSNKITARIDEIAIHNDTLWTADEVNKIYARSSRKFVLENIDGSFNVQSKFSIPVEKDAAIFVNNNGKLGIGVSNPTLGDLQITQSGTTSNDGFTAFNGTGTVRVYVDSSNYANIQSAGAGDGIVIINRGGGTTVIGNTSQTGQPLEVTSNSGAQTILLRGRSSDGTATIQFVTNDGNTLYGVIQGEDDRFEVFVPGSLTTSQLVLGFESTTNGPQIQLIGDAVSGGASGDVKITAENSSNGDIFLYTQEILRASFDANGTIALWVGVDSLGTDACFSGGTGAIRNIGVCSSSIRYKDNVETLSDKDSEKLYQLRPVAFVWNSGAHKGKSDFGLIAEEVNEILPELIVRSESGEIEGLNYRHLSAFMISEIQRLRQENDDFKTRLIILEAQ